MKFNFSLRGRNQTDARYASIQSWVPDIQWELYTALLSFSLTERSGLCVEELFQQGIGEDWLSIRRLIRENDPDFVAKLALFLREQLPLERLSHLLTAELALQYGSQDWAGRLAATVIQQPAALPEWLSCYSCLSGQRRTGRYVRPGRVIRKRLAGLFDTLDEYQFLRYDRHMQSKLREILLLLRPKAKDAAHRILFSRMVKDLLPARISWEQELVALHLQHYDSIELKQMILRDKWKELISSFRMGYTALLANVRPVLLVGVSGKVLKLAAEYLGNAAAVVRSSQQPYGLLNTYRELKEMQQGGCGMLMESLEKAALHSAWNIPGFSEEMRIVIAMDVSNSMRRPVREGSLVQRYDIGPLLGMLLQERCRQVMTGILGNTWKPVELTSKAVLAGVNTFHTREGEAGYATNGHLVIEDLLKKGLMMDKVFLFTDCEQWNSRPFNQSSGADLRSAWRAYRQLAPQAKLYLFDLAGYGKKPLEILPEGVHLIAGWNERIFRTLKAVERGKDTMERIHAIEW